MNYIHPRNHIREGPMNGATGDAKGCKMLQISFSERVEYHSTQLHNTLVTSGAANMCYCSFARWVVTVGSILYHSAIRHWAMRHRYAAPKARNCQHIFKLLHPSRRVLLAMCWATVPCRANRAVAANPRLVDEYKVLLCYTVYINIY